MRIALSQRQCALHQQCMDTWLSQPHRHQTLALCWAVSKYCAVFQCGCVLIHGEVRSLFTLTVSLCDLPVCVLCHFSNWVIIALTHSQVIFCCQLTWLLSAFIKRLLCSRFSPRGNLNFCIIRLRFCSSGSMFCWISPNSECPRYALHLVVYCPPRNCYSVFCWLWDDILTFPRELSCVPV